MVGKMYFLLKYVLIKSLCFSLRPDFWGENPTNSKPPPPPKASVSSYREAKMMGPTTRAIAPKEAIAPGGGGSGESTYKNQKENHQ